MTRRNNSTFTELGRQPCPVCGHAGRCKANPDLTAVLCFRQTADHVSGFRRVKRTGECSSYVAVSSAANTTAHTPHGPTDWQRKTDEYVGRLCEERRVALARQLHVIPNALQRIRVGWNGRCYTFPECDAKCRVIGIATRSPLDGTKRALRGSKRGLVVPADLDRARPLLVVEGATDTAAALTVGLQAIGRPHAEGGVAHLSELLAGWSGDIIIVGERDKKRDGQWPGRKGAITVAKELTRRLGRTIVWSLPPRGVKDLRECVRHEAADLTDNQVCMSAGERILAALGERAETVDEQGAEAGAERVGGNRPPSQSTLLVEIAESAELFHDGDTAHATIPVGQHLETWPIRSKGFRRWLSREFHRQHGRTPASQSVQDAFGVIEGQALFEGTERKVFVRVGHADGALYLDLVDSEWRCSQVTPDGWQVISSADAPVRFRRSRGMLPLPEPMPGGSLTELRAFVNVRDDRGFVLVISWLIGALQPTGPYPLLLLNGEQGSAKSCICRMLRRLLDPNQADLRSEPRDERDLVVAASNGWVIALDNLSRVQPGLSDGLCRIATGGGFATRELYTDADEAIFVLQRPIVLNGIDELAARPDLLDRSIIETLPAIEDSDRRDEAELWAAYEDARPRLLGALLTAVSAAIRMREAVQLDQAPRMADFARWISAAEQGGGVPWSPGAFMEAYVGNRHAAVDSAIEASPIGSILLNWLDGRAAWTGTATELLGELDAVAEERAKRVPGWPKGGRGLSGAIRRLAPALRARGVAVVFSSIGRGRSKRRAITLEASEETPSTVPTVPIAPNSHCDARSPDQRGPYSDSGAAGVAGSRPANKRGSGPENGLGGGGDDGGATLPFASGMDGRTLSDVADPELVYDPPGETIGAVPVPNPDEWGEI